MKIIHFLHGRAFCSRGLRQCNRDSSESLDTTERSLGALATRRGVLPKKFNS